MFKYLWIMLPIFIIIPLHCMKDNHPKTIGTAAVIRECGFNFFSELPDEICDLIAQYLIFNDIETEKEFIERTKKRISVANYIKLSPNKMCVYNTKYNLKLFFLREGFFTQNYHKANKTAVLYCKAGASFLHITATDTEQELSQITFYSCRPCHSLIGSLDAQLFAALHDVWVSNGIEDNIHRAYCNTMLTVIDVVHYEKESFIIPEDFLIPNFYLYGYKFPSVIAFNKQKTHVIMHGRDQKLHSEVVNHFSENYITDYRIIPLTCTAQKESQNKKTLQHYFAHKGICKQISQ